MKKSTTKGPSAGAPPAMESAPARVQPGQQVQVPLFYADAIGNLLMSPITSRVSLVVNVGPAKDGAQPTVPAMELVIPTAALLAFGRQLRQMLRERGPELAKSHDAVGKLIAEITAEAKG